MCDALGARCGLFWVKLLLCYLAESGADYKGAVSWVVDTDAVVYHKEEWQEDVSSDGQESNKDCLFQRRLVG